MKSAESIVATVEKRGLERDFDVIRANIFDIANSLDLTMESLRAKVNALRA